jgi:hypothetical protein
VERHGFVLLARPLFTPTTPKACPFGRALLHCGQEISLPRTGAGAGAAELLAARALELLIKNTDAKANTDAILKTNLFILLL